MIEYRQNIKDNIYLWLKVAFDCLFILKMSFLAKSAKINYKSEKTFRRYMYIHMEGVAKFLVIFVQKYFYPSWNKFGNEKIKNLKKN